MVNKSIPEVHRHAAEELFRAAKLCVRAMPNTSRTWLRHALTLVGLVEGDPLKALVEHRDFVANWINLPVEES
jgi:hypothetical protein